MVDLSAPKFGWLGVAALFLTGCEHDLGTMRTPQEMPKKCGETQTCYCAIPIAVAMPPGASAGTAEVALHHFSSPAARWRRFLAKSGWQFIALLNFFFKQKTNRNILYHFLGGIWVLCLLGGCSMLLSPNCFLQCWCRNVRDRANRICLFWAEHLHLATCWSCGCKSNSIVPSRKVPG